MDDKDVRKLIDFISKSKFSEFEMEREGFRIRLVKESRVPAAVGPAREEFPVPVAVIPEASPSGPVPAPAETPVPHPVNLVKSPIVGTFFRSPSPNSPPFVEVGDRIHKGQTLCIIEAMKVMNEIESDTDGEILEIGAANGQPVEFGEILFRVLPPSSQG